MRDLTEPVGLRSVSQNEFRQARRLLRAKDRHQQRLFLAEGPQAVREALLAPGVVQTVFSTAEAAVRYPELAAGAGRLEPEQLRELTGTVTPQGLVAVCSFLDRGLAGLFSIGRAPRLVACCAEIRDPGNAGTVIRCADAAGADAVIFSAESVDLYNPKTVRASAGSLFHLPVVIGVELGEAIGACRSAGLRVRATAGSADLDLAGLDAAGRLAEPTAWLFGNEARGLASGQAGLADELVSIPVYGKAESLNLSTAAAVCLYASAFAQRR